jgi:hypothetical protein
MCRLSSGSLCISNSRVAVDPNIARKKMPNPQAINPPALRNNFKKHAAKECTRYHQSIPNSEFRVPHSAFRILVGIPPELRTYLHLPHSEQQPLTLHHSPFRIPNSKFRIPCKLLSTDPGGDDDEPWSP